MVRFWIKKVFKEISKVISYLLKKNGKLIIINFINIKNLKYSKYNKLLYIKKSYL